MKAVYLDNHTVTKPFPEVISAMLPFLVERWGVPSSPHSFGQELYSELEKGYRDLYALVDASTEDSFILTSSSAEAINHVIFSTYHDVTRKTGKNHFVTSTLDEAPMIMAQNRLKEMGCGFQMASANSRGFVTADAVGDAITPRTALVSLSMGNGLIGTLNPIAEIATLCKERGILFHIDVSHVLGKVDFSLKDINADFVTFSGDHIHGPRSTGGLFIKDGTKISPFIIGGNDQGGKRGGPLNVSAFMGLAVASRKILEGKDYQCTEVVRLRDKFEKGILEKVSGAKIHFKEENRLPHISSICFPHVYNEALGFLLNKKKVFASFGGGASQQIAHVLKASGVSPLESVSSLSFALSYETKEEEIEMAIERISKSVLHLQKCGKHL